jgi:4-hydroxy-3-polyprenylbenzoate decarboxylase
VSWADDLHFQTRTTIDTLDYSAGLGLNAGSKLVVAAAGRPRRTPGTQFPAGLKLPDGFTDPRVVMPGVLAVRGPKYDKPDGAEYEPAVRRFCRELTGGEEFPLVVVVDDSGFVAGHVNNFLWVTFTRSDPAGDVHGAGEFVRQKHWGCWGPLVIDARTKPHHAPPLEEDPAVSERVGRLAAKGGPLHGVI